MKNYVYAGFWRRTLAVLINMVIAMIFYFIFLNLDTYISIVGQRPILVDVLNIASMFFSCVVSVLMLRFLGADIGGLILKMRVVNAETGNHQSVKNLIIRFFMQYFNFLSFVSIFYDSRKQGWHDKVSSSLVVVKSGNEQEYRIEFPTFSTDKDRRFNFLIYVFTILFVLANTAFLTISLHEDPLLPEAAAWIGEHMEKEENPEDNGYYYLIGFGMTTDENQFENGYQIVQEINKKSLETREKVRNRLMGKDLLSPIQPQLPLKAEKNYLIEDKMADYLLNLGFNETIVDTAMKYKTELKEIMDNVRYLDAQFNNLAKHKYFSVTTGFNYNEDELDSYTILLKYIKLKIMVGLSNLTEYDSSCIEALNRVDEFARSLLMSIENETQAMFVKIFLFFKPHVLNILLDKSESTSMIIDQILKMDNLPEDYIQSQKLNKRNFKNSISQILLYLPGKNDIFFRSSFYMNPEEISTFYSRDFKPNKFINSEYLYCSSLGKKQVKDGKETEIFNPDHLLIKKNVFNILNNPISVRRHETRLIDTTLLLLNVDREKSTIHLLKLKAMIYRDHVKEENIQEFLNAHADSLYDVLTGEPMKWNSDEQEIYFGEKSETPEEYEAYLKMERDEKKNRRFRTSRHENPDALKLYFD